MKAILLATLLVGAAGMELAATTPLAAAPLVSPVPLVSDGKTLVEQAHYGRRRGFIVYATPYYRPYHYRPHYYGYTYYAPRRYYRHW